MQTKARTLFYVSAAILCLAITFHLGASSAGAQASSGIAGFAGNADAYLYVILPNGDVYKNWAGDISAGVGASYVGNYWGGATPTQSGSWGGVKSRYLGKTPGNVPMDAQRAPRDGR